MINILLPTDFSQNAQDAADFVFRLFDASSIRVHLMHAVVPPRSAPGMMINIADLMLKDAEKDVEREKDRLIEAYPAAANNIESHAKLGYLMDVIPTMCRSKNIQLIVMGTLGENDMASKILGSNTEQIIRKAFAPVLAVPTGFAVSDHPKICIATAKDRIPHTEVLESMFTKLKDQHHVDLSVLHVLTSDKDKALKSIQFNGMQIRVEVETAESAEEGINMHIKSHSLDMLVVCHRHNSRIDYLFQRSTTKKLAGEIQVPLMIMPAD